MLRAPTAWLFVVRLVAVIMTLSLSGVSHAAQEVVEDLAHEATEGHSAHAAEHPEGRQLTGSEHECFGLAHHCRCCSSVADCPDGAIRLAEPGIRNVRTPADKTRRTLGVADRVDRPPRS